MATDVIFIENQRQLIARLPSELDHHTVGRVRESVDSRFFKVRPDVLVLDFGSVGFMDSSGIALIIGRVEVARALGASVRLIGLSRSTMKLCRLAGLERIRNLTIATPED